MFSAFDSNTCVCVWTEFICTMVDLQAAYVCIFSSDDNKDRSVFKVQYIHGYLVSIECKTF